MIVVSHYTNEFYQALAVDMRATAEAHGITTVQLYGFAPGASWQENCNRKVQALMAAHDVAPHHPLLYVDTDVRFKGRPTFFDTVFEPIAARLIRPGEPCSAVLYLNAFEQRTEFLKRWLDKVTLEPQHPDDVVHLRDLVREMHLKVRALSPAYCWIERQMRRRFPVCKPVIEHYELGLHNAVYKEKK